MNICSISDTHGSIVDIPDGCDILTISGDISPCWRGYDGVVQQRQFFFEEFLRYYKSKCKHLVFVAGNHDFFLKFIHSRNQEDDFRKSLPEGVHYLRDSGVEIEGIKFWGTPWTPMFCGWYFMERDNKDGIGKYFADIPLGVDIMLSHGPAYGHNDVCCGHNVSKLGSKMLVSAIRQKAPKYLFVGHIHTGDHKPSLISPSVSGLEYTKSVNVSVLDEKYEVWQTPFSLNL